MTVKDSEGRELALGDIVLQTIVYPERGALNRHYEERGKVTGIGRTRVEVTFPGNIKRLIQGGCVSFSHKGAPPPGPINKLAEHIKGLAADDFVSLSSKNGFLNLRVADIRTIVALAGKGETNG